MRTPFAHAVVELTTSSYAGEVEALESCGIEWRERAEESIAERHALQERSPHATGGDEIAALPFIVERRVDRRIRPRACNVRENTLGAAALIEIVVDEGDAQCCSWVRGKTSANVYFCKYALTTRWTSEGVTASIAPRTLFG